MRRVNALLYQRPALFAPCPRFGKCQHPRSAPGLGLLFGFAAWGLHILPHGKDVFLARDAVAVAPQLRASRSHFQIKPAAVG